MPSNPAATRWKPRASACPNAHDLAHSDASALKGPRIPAQGNALGFRTKEKEAL